jgi:thiol-disulfide isomerase/thioredoxin
VLLAPLRAAPAIAAGADEDHLRRLTAAFAGFEARDMNGRRWSSDGLRGRVVVLDFWATWCPPCLPELPVLRRIRATFGDHRVQVLGVTFDVTDQRTLRASFNRHRVDWPQIWERRGYDSELGQRFGVTSLPASLLIDATGRVRAVNLRGSRLHDAVAAVLAEQRD